MNSYFFNGRSRENKMRVASDHRPTREQVLEEAQKRRQARMEAQRRNQCAGRIQRTVRAWQACQFVIRLAVETILSLEQNANHNEEEEEEEEEEGRKKQRLFSKSCLSVCAVTRSRHREPVQWLGQVCWCFHYIQQHRAKMSITLLEHLAHSPVDSTGQSNAFEAGNMGQKTLLPFTSRLSVMEAQHLLERRCSAIVSDAVRNFLRQGIGARFPSIQHVPQPLLARIIPILIDGIPNGLEDEHSNQHGWEAAERTEERGALGTLRELAMAVATGGSAEAMEAVLAASLRACMVSLTAYPNARRKVLAFLLASLRLQAGQSTGCLPLASVAWREACWACLTAPTAEEYLPLTANPLVVLLSAEPEAAVDEGGQTQEGKDLEDWAMFGGLVRGIVFVVYAHLQTFLASGVFPNLRSPSSMDGAAPTTAKNVWQAVGMGVLGRLTQLLPYFLQSNERRAGGQETASSSPSSCLYMLTQKVWLWCIGMLCEKLCQTDLFVQTILFDLHHSRADGFGGVVPSQCGGGRVVEGCRTACTRYRSLVSYLFSSTGGLCLLEQLAMCPEEPDSGSLPLEGSLPEGLDSVWGQTFNMSVLEITCSVYAWPLYIFSMASPARRLETAAVFARLVRSSSLIRQLWQLYKKHSEGLLYILEKEELLHTLCVEIAAPSKGFRLPFWPDPPRSLLAGAPNKVSQKAFWDPTPTISVLFFTLFCYYIDVTNFVEELHREVVLSQRECWALILALKEIVYRSHFHGVVPSVNSEAVAHLACNLLSKLHVIDEATLFVPSSSLWICMTNGDMMRTLSRVSTEMWGDITARHNALQRALEQRVDDCSLTQSFADNAEGGSILDENDASPIASREHSTNAPPNRQQTLPGDNLLFQNSCQWGVEERFMYILFHAPFLVSFPERAELLTMLLLTQQLNHFPLLERNFVVRRGRVFVDAFERFRSRPDSPEMYAVRFANDNNELEEGYGKGVYRELMVSLCIEGFAVEHGLFRQTESGMVYPNPLSYEATGDPDHLQKIAFLGAMVGRSLCDGILQDVPFALHFRNSLLGRRNSINNLKSFDNQLYRQLRSLAELDAEDVEAMGLTFVYTVNALGITREIELISGGADITVTANNCLHYMHLVSDFKLNREGSEQTRAFQAGLEAIIKPAWLQLFDSNELLKLFSGDESGKIDIADWKAHTVYQKKEDAESTPVRIFWEVVESLTTEQQRLLLKFATSMNRPPLLGFRFLFPMFNLQLLQPSMKDRLPSASTCFSTLKLPPYTDFATARQKIIAALEGTATFDLS